MVTKPVSWCMIPVLLGLAVLAVATSCGVAVYRTGHTRPVFRAVLTAALVIVSPIVCFWLFTVVLTSTLPVPVVAPPVVLLGLGLYVVAEGTVPVVTGTPAQ